MTKTVYIDPATGRFTKPSLLAEPRRVMTKSLRLIAGKWYRLSLSQEGRVVATPTNFQTERDYNVGLFAVKPDSR